LLLVTSIFFYNMLKPILVVDDDLNDRALCQIALARIKLLNEVICIGSGEEALDFLMCRHHYASREPGNPSVILLDLKMPKIDGFAVLAAIRADPTTARIPVVMLTGSSEAIDVTRSYELGSNAFVTKPLEFLDFVDTLAKVAGFWGTLNEAPVGSAKYRPPTAGTAIEP
jgi:CheY-like chemotaxis protein